MFVAYYRVSTQKQGRSGLGLEAQQHAVAEYAKRLGQPITGEYTEVESGRCRDRPHLKAALAKCRAGGFTLVVAKLDRLARDVSLILSLVDSGVKIVFLDLPDLSTDPIVGRLVLTVLAAIAEFEARRIGQRLAEALARRKARGLPLGSHDTKCPSFAKPAHRKKAAAAGAAAQRTAAGRFRDEVRPLALGLRSEGRTLAQVAAELNSRGVATPRGKLWTLANLEVFLKGRNWKCPPGATNKRRGRSRVGKGRRDAEKSSFRPELGPQTAPA